MLRFFDLQRDLTASIKDAETSKLLGTAWEVYRRGMSEQKIIDEARRGALIEEIARFLANNTDMNCQDSIGIKLPEKLWHDAHNEYGRDSAYRRILLALKATHCKANPLARWKDELE